MPAEVRVRHNESVTAERLRIEPVSDDFTKVVLNYGFMDEPNVMRALALCRMQHFHVNLMETSFFIGREKIRPRQILLPGGLTIIWSFSRLSNSSISQRGTRWRSLG